MKTADLDYLLPPQLIAQQPADRRDSSRLLVLSRASGEMKDRTFTDIRSFLRAGDCLVLNDTRVIPARFFAKKTTGARIEGLFLETRDDCWHVLLKNARGLKPGDSICLIDGSGAAVCPARVREELGEGAWLIDVEAASSPFELLERIGMMPLPPYIKRKNGTHEQAACDKERYQTVYARSFGAVAAPTAGLHFTPELIADLKHDGVQFAYCTLHVGLGTFRPVTVDDLDGHHIHSENYVLTEENARIINQAKAAAGRIIAVGTTSVRTLETIAADGPMRAQSGSTQLFIQPGYEFKIVDAMVTNFHLPRSTLIALVSAFAGLDKIKAAYAHAVEQRYRFYSYGDAMMII
jgi:S-adenosylmethionine:tRNA ribosyltransferase-isomerase